NAQRINLAPLSDADTAQLVSALLERAVLPAETQRALLERAGGNPLYAEEFVRLLADRGQPGEEAEVPESVQALIAARLDTLPAERKSLLQDASVLGTVVWADVLAHHYQAALELNRAAGIDEQAEQLQAQAVRYLAMAGERALALDVDQAERQLALALELAPAGDPARASLLECWAQAAQQQG